LLALRWSSRNKALLVAIAYGIGSCVWSISSQSLWQQSVNQFFLILGAYLLLGPLRERNAALLAGLSFGAAVATRATSVIFLLAVLVYLLVYQRKNAIYFLLGAAPLPLAIAVYNFHFFGNPITFAQELVGHDLAREKTGSADLWQTPLLKGLRGLLLSPSRGLLVFSPVFVLSFWGMLRI
jgi:Gpi18-like mannosyltransferase